MLVCEFECFSSRNNLNVSLLDGECKAESNWAINQLYFVLQARGRHVGVLKWDTANQQVARRKKVSQSASRIEGTRPISDSFALMEIMGRFLLLLDVASYFCSGFWLPGIGSNSWYHSRNNNTFSLPWEIRSIFIHGRPAKVLPAVPDLVTRCCRKGSLILSKPITL